MTPSRRVACASTTWAEIRTNRAAEFVHWHIADTEAVWGHIDLAGPASREERGTGFGVGLIAETIERLVAAKA